jgi:disulfide bond formation protein DsbB
MIATVIHLLGILVLFGQLFIILSLINLIFSFKFLKWINRYNVSSAFTISLISTLGSLFLSEIAGMAPCELCWFQRIFMYPLVLIFGIALYKNDNKVVFYALPMSIIGMFISMYHNYLIWFTVPTSCSGVSCTTKYITELGYITIPLMALTGFIMIILLMTIYNNKFLK